MARRKTPTTPKRVSPLEVRLARDLLAAGLAWDGWDCQWGDGRTRTDFLYWLPRRAGLWRGVAVEVEGGGYIRGRHHREPGYSRDCAKYNRMGLDARLLVLRGTEAMLRDGSLLAAVRDALTQGFYRPDPDRTKRAAAELAAREAVLEAAAVELARARALAKAERAKTRRPRKEPAHGD